MRSYSLVHLRHLIERRLLGEAALAEICDECVIVCPEETFDHPPAIFLPNQLDNITSLHNENSKEAEKIRVHGGRGVHRATKAYKLTQAHFHHSGVYKKNWSSYFPHYAPPTTPEKIQGGRFALASSYPGVFYFGHFIRDDSPTYLLAEKYADPICARTPPWSQKQGYLDVFDFSWPVIDEGYFDELYIFDDIGQNSHKAARKKELRRRFRAKIKPKFSDHKVYLRRGDTGIHKRIITNEAEMMAELEKEGFIILDNTTASLETIMETLADAKLFVTVDGSHQAHAICAIADGAGYLTIQPPNMFNNSAKDWSPGVGFQYGFVVGETDGDGFKVDIPDLLKTAEMMEAVL